MEAYGRRNPEERTWRVIEAVRSVAEARGVSMAQVALAWLVDRPAVTSVILGARTLEQLDDNLGAAGLHLPGRGDGPPRPGQHPDRGRLSVRRARGEPARPRASRSLVLHAHSVALTFEISGYVRLDGS